MSCQRVELLALETPESESDTQKHAEVNKVEAALEKVYMISKVVALAQY